MSTERPQFLYLLTPSRVGMLTDGPTPGEAQAVEQHFAYLQRLMHAGVLILAGRTLNADEGTFGIAVFAAESEEAARRIMADDPAVSRGVMRAELFPYRVALISEANAQ